MKLLSFATLVIALIMLPRANAGTSTSATNSDLTANAKDSVVARGKDFAITWRDMDQVLSTARANPQDELPPDAEIHVIEQLIEIQLVLQKATAAEKAAGKQAAEKRFADILKTLSPAEFERRLQATHMTPDDLRRMFFEEDTAQASLTRQLGIKVTDADAKNLFDSNPPGSYDHPARARVRELVLLTTSDFAHSSAPPLPEAVIQAKHKQIFDLHQRALAGEDFAALAKQYNEDPISKDDGDVLSFRREEMEFGDLAFSKQTNQISEVMTNEEGYRFFQLLEIIPLKKVAFADIADTLKKALIADQQRSLAPDYIRKLWKEADVEILDPKLKADVAANEAEAVEAERAQAAFKAKQEAEATNAPPEKP